MNEYISCSDCCNFDFVTSLCKVTYQLVNPDSPADLCSFYNIEHYAVGATVGNTFDAITSALLKLKEAAKNATDTIIRTFGNVENLALSTYPDGRIVELALHSKKARVRKKNMSKIMKWYWTKEQ